MRGHVKAPQRKRAKRKGDKLDILIVAVNKLSEKLDAVIAGQGSKISEIKYQGDEA